MAYAAGMNKTVKSIAHVLEQQFAVMLQESGLRLPNPYVKGGSKNVATNVPNNAAVTQVGDRGFASKDLRAIP